MQNKMTDMNCNIYLTILTINVLLILQVRDFFFLREKHIMGPFEGFLRSSRLFWPLKMVPSEARGHFGAKKVDYVFFTNKKEIILNL